MSPGNHEVWGDPKIEGVLNAVPWLKKFGVTPENLIYKFDFKGVRFIYLWSGKYDYRSPSLWDADRPKYAEQMMQMQQWLDEAKAQGIKKAFITFHYPVFARSGLGPIPAETNPHKVIASYAKDMELVVFNGHVHTTEMYDVDGVKYLMLGGGGAEQDPILPGRTSIKTLPADYPPDLYWKGQPPAGGVQLRPRRREARREDEIHSQPLPARIGRAVCVGGVVQVERADGDSEARSMVTTLLIVHGLVAVALLGAITHQALAMLGIGRSPAGFVLRPVSHRARRILRQRRHRSVRRRGAAGRNRVFVLSSRHQAGFGASRILADARALRHQGALRLHRIGAAAGLLGVLAAATCQRFGPNACHPDDNSGLYRLVELSNRSRSKQPARIWRMTSSHAFRRFAFAYGTAFAILYVVALKLDLALFTVYPSLGIVLLGTHHSRDTVDPAMGFLAPAMYWYGWTATAALGALVVGLVACIGARAVDAPVSVRMDVVGNPRARDDRVRLPDVALVSTFAGLGRLGRDMVVAETVLRR